MHYGLPSGLELKQLLLNELNTILSSTRSRSIFFESGNISTETVDEFIEGFTMGQDFTTIDYFLGQMEDDDFKKIGNALIALVISKQQSLINFSENPDWYDLFFKLIIESTKEEVQNTKIITFNYDTSLEKFIEKRITAETPRSNQKYIKEKLSRLEFIHPHGQLAFKDSYSVGNVFTKAPIKTISDDFTTDSNYQKAKEIIPISNEIIFLGFGYHEEILNNLFSQEQSLSIESIINLVPRDIVGTNIGFDDKQLKYNFLSSESIFPRHNIDCKEMVEFLIQYKTVKVLKNNARMGLHSKFRPPNNYY